MRVRSGAVSAAVLLLLLAALAWRSVGDTDFGIHVAGGRWIAEHGRVPAEDPFTWTVPDHPYVAYHWLFQLALYETLRLAGAPGVAALRLALLLATGLLLADVLRVRGVSPLAGAAVGLAAILASEWRFTLRPELASWLLAALLLWVLERRRAGRVAPTWLLPVGILLWANLHIWILGFAILLVYAAEECARRRSLRTPLVAWSALAFAAAFANPYGARAVAYPLLLATRLGGENVFAQHISELASPLALAPDPRHPFTTSVQLHAWRVLWLAGWLGAALHLARRRFADAALLVAFGALSALAVRNVALYAVVATPALAVALDDALGAGRAGSRRLRVAGGVALACVLAYALLLLPRIVSGSFYAEGRRLDRFAGTLCRPCLALETADWVASRDLRGRGFNNLVAGGTLEWRDPGRRTFIDARNEVTGETFFREYLRAMEPEHWAETQRRWRFDYAVLAHRGDARAAALAGKLLADPAWRLVHLDGAGAVFVRADGPDGGLPAVSLPPPLAPAERRRLLARLAEPPATAARWRRWLWSRERAPGPEHDLGNFLLGAGHAAEAERPLLAAAEAHPDFWEPFLNLGVLYQRLDLPRAALRAFERAHTLAPDHPDLAPLGGAGDRKQADS